MEGITAWQRVGMLDLTSNSVRDWSLGFNMDGIHYGRHCSPRAFGQAGAMCSVTFADPEYGLAVGLAFNGMPGPIPHV